MPGFVCKFSSLGERIEKLQQVTNNSSFQNYTHPDDHILRTTDTPGFKPSTLLRNYY